MKAPLAKNEIRKSLSMKAKNAELQLEGKRVINHSAEKTCISRLLDADILENFVAQLRKSLQGEFTILHAVSKL